MSITFRKSGRRELASHCWRVLAKGSIAGCTYDLDLDGHELALKLGDRIIYDLPREKVLELAKAEVAKRHGQQAAETAEFHFVWENSL